MSGTPMPNNPTEGGVSADRGPEQVGIGEQVLQYAGLLILLRAQSGDAPRQPQNRYPYT